VAATLSDEARKRDDGAFFPVDPRHVQPPLARRQGVARSLSRVSNVPPCWNSSLVTICYLAGLMSKRKFTKRKVVTPDLDPATLAQLKTFERLRKRSNRALLKRRRQKSGQ
jgi:hypothetical protein